MNAAVSRRKPLDMVRKWEVLQHWAQQQQRLTSSAFLVLVRLLDRQNTKTGRCDPSGIGIAEEVGLSERSIRNAIAELERRGAIKKYKKARYARNQYLIFSKQELEQHASRSPLGARFDKGRVKPVSRGDERRFPQEMKPVSHEQIKEKEKKKEGAETGDRGQPGCTRPDNGRLRGMSQESFEQAIVRYFNDHGLGYEDVINIDVETIEAAYHIVRSGGQALDVALDGLFRGSLVEQARAGRVLLPSGAPCG